MQKIRLHTIQFPHRAFGVAFPHVTETYFGRQIAILFTLQVSALGITIAILGTFSFANVQNIICRCLGLGGLGVGVGGLRG